MNKQEARWITTHREWIKDTLPTSKWEAKHTRGEKSFRMSELKEHQRDALLAPIVLYKIPDDSMSFKPFDGVLLKDVPGYVMITYPEGFVALDIKALEEVHTPSLSFDNAIALASFTSFK